MGTVDTARFIECEKWRQEINLDETVPTWEYPEKVEMFKYYPQYYHKTDKVPLVHSNLPLSPPSGVLIPATSRTAAPSTSSSSAAST